MSERTYRTAADLRAQLHGLFAQVAVGRGNALKGDEIVARLRGGYTKDMVRDAIVELIHVDGLPIASTSSSSTGGYYRPANWYETRIALKELWSRVRALVKRARALARNHTAIEGGQATFDFQANPAEVAAWQNRTDRAAELLGEDDDDELSTTEWARKGR